jgi:ABC-type polysaccharide/polyol phosphate transport system ATPase subunit
MAQIEETCNRVIWLEKGQIVRAGYNVPEIVDAYLEATGGEPRVREPA